MNLRQRFALKRASDTLARVKDLATALAFISRKPGPLALLGLAAHLANVVVGAMECDIAAGVASWHRLQVSDEMHMPVTEVLQRACIRQENSWHHSIVEGRSVLFHMERSRGEFYAERDPQVVMAWIRAQLWQQTGARTELVAQGPWGDIMGMRAWTPPPALDSARAREVWALIEPMMRAGEVRSLLLDGMPRTGKSTIVRRLIELAEDLLGRRLRVLRIGVADFQYLRASAIAGAVRLLEPDVLVVDDLDRFGANDTLLDLFEQLRQHVSLVLTTSNDPTKIPVALKLPGRIDEVYSIPGAGPEMAECLLGPFWGQLSAAEQAMIELWPVGLIHELRVRATCRGADRLSVEVLDLEKSAELARGPAKILAAPA